MISHRITKLQSILEQKNLDAFFISNFYNILYLTGFKTLTVDEREAFLVVTCDKVFLFTDGRYFDKSSKLKCQKSKLEYRLIEPQKGLIQHLQEIIREQKIIKLGFEPEDLKFIEYQKLKEGLKSINLIAQDELIIKSLREIKDEKEVEKIKKACGIGDQCLADLTKQIKLGMTEKELVYKLEAWLKRKGYNLAFDPIVAIDENSAIPHYNTQTGHAKVKNNSLILIDFSVKYEDYVSDITRVFFHGPPKNPILNIYNKLLAAQEQTLKKGAKLKEAKAIDEYCRSLLIKVDLPNFPHSTGHGVGLEIHEFPKIAYNSADQIGTNQVFTIEPGVYLQDKFGIRIEDIVWKKSENDFEILTKFPKKPLIIK